MAVVVRLGPLPLGRRRTARVRELERIFATAVELIEVDVAALAAAMEMHDVLAVALDASAGESRRRPRSRRTSASPSTAVEARPKQPR